MAAEYVLKEGNENVMLCERGIRTFETAYRFTLDLTAVPVLKELTHLPVDRRPQPRRRPARPRRAAVARGRGRGGRRRHHRRGAPAARGGDLRRPAAAARRATSPTTPRRSSGPPRSPARRSAVHGRGRRVIVAVVGVGLIGGSVGLAARARLGATVAAGPTRDARARASSAARSTRPRRRSRRRSRRRRRVRRRARRRAARTRHARCSPPRRPDCVVTDVGSTKRAVVGRDRRRALRRRPPARRRRGRPASSTRARTSSTAPPGT